MIALSGGLCGREAYAVETSVAAALDRGHRRVVLDLLDVREADADGVAALCGALRLVTDRGGDLVAVGLRPGLIPRVSPLVADGLEIRGTLRAAVAPAAS